MPANLNRSVEDSMILTRLKAFFPGHSPINMAFLFGSRARGKAGPESDVDVAVYLEPGYTRADVYKIWDALEDILRKKVDLVVLNDAPPLLAWTALKGQRLFVRNYRFYLQYMLDISREAEDFQAYVLDWWRWRMKTKGAV